MTELQVAETEEKEPFQIIDDGSLSWVFREILIPLKAKVERTKALAKIDYERVEKWEQNELRAPLQDIAYWEQRIADYHLDLLSKDPKQKTISTPYGKSKTTTSAEQPDKGDEEKLLKYAKDNKLTELIKVEETIRWGDLKKTLKVVDGKVIDENGEIVEGAKVKPQTVTCKVELN